jgi:hypothetical protein
VGVRRGDHHRADRRGIAAEHLDRLAQVGVGHGVDRLLQIVERGIERRDRLRLVAAVLLERARVDAGSRCGAPERRQEVVGRRDVHVDLAHRAHPRARPPRELIGRRRLGQRRQLLLRVPDLVGQDAADPAGQRRRGHRLGGRRGSGGRTLHRALGGRLGAQHARSGHPRQGQQGRRGDGGRSTNSPSMHGSLLVSSPRSRRQLQ